MASGKTLLRSSLGEVRQDSNGAPIGVVRMDHEISYAGLPALLQRLLNEDSAEAWSAIKGKIDYTYESIGAAIAPIFDGTSLAEQVRAELAAGKKLLLKPNLVSIMTIDSGDRSEGAGYAACTSWVFVAAVMRWFHDHLDVSYHQMALGEAATLMDAARERYRVLHEREVTAEAVIEGRLGEDLYGGWGFYFARRYLAETHSPSHYDDPMMGYEDSLAGVYLPPGKAMDRLPVYDLNAARDGRGREINVPNGVNFSSVVLHKAVIGGDPADREDRRDYPGCVILNAPKLKVHDIALLTNAVKNLGIGLYPMDAAVHEGKDDWLYAGPQGAIPGMKSRIPHEVWVPEMDGDGVLPRRDEQGKVIARKTGGMPATMADIIEATLSQGVKVIIVVDGIETLNLSNTEGINGMRAAEGLVFAGTDLLAVDLACARYLFKTVPMAEARKLQREQGLPSDFLQRQPLPAAEGSNIITREGVDSPISRYNAFSYVEKRGLGSSRYHVAGSDVTTGDALVSVDGHIGSVHDGEFVELMPETMYFAMSKPLLDLQAMVMGYADANDKLTGSDFRRQFLDTFDENGDGVIDYDETGRNGVITGLMLTGGGNMVSTLGSERYGAIRGRFLMRALTLRLSNQGMNEEGLDLTGVFMNSSVAALALMMSQLEMEAADPFVPGLTWGKGKWPSLQLARYLAIGGALYGQQYPLALDIQSLYGAVFQYADRVYNGSRWVGDRPLTGEGIVFDTTPLTDYVKAVAEGTELLPFVLYVPQGYADCAGCRVPNVVETSDPKLVLRAVLADGKEVW